MKGRRSSHLACPLSRLDLGLPRLGDASEKEYLGGKYGKPSECCSCYGRAVVQRDVRDPLHGLVVTDLGVVRVSWVVAVIERTGSGRIRELRQD